MSMDTSHPIYEMRKAAQIKALTSDADQRYFDEFWTLEMTEKRKKRIDENVKRRENEYFTRIIGKIQALIHSDVPTPKTKKVDTRTPYWKAMDEAAADILRNDPEHQKWLADQPRRRKLMKDAMSYLDSVHHLWWELRPGTLLPEPPRGDSTKRREYEEWAASCKKDATTSTQRNTEIDLFTEAQKKRLTRKPLKTGDFMVLASGSTEEEE